MQTAAQLVTLATQIAKAPAFTTQAGYMLNAILRSLAMDYDCPESRQTFNPLTISPNGGTGQNTQFYPLTLPSSALYLRTREVFYSVSGTIFYLSQLSLQNYDKLFQGAGISNYPYWYSVDTEGSGASQAVPQMAFYPPPNLSLSLTVRLQFLPADITTPSSSSAVPWFREQQYLYTKLASELMSLTGDARRDQFKKDADDLLLGYLKMIDDKQNYATTVIKDPNRFRNVSQLKPTKTTGF